MVYARKAREKILTFQVSGKLWNRSLVMRDMETGSLWSHILGSCMEGTLRGSDLKILAAVMTTWDDWRKKNPHTTVLNLPRTSAEYNKEFYAVLVRDLRGRGRSTGGRGSVEYGERPRLQNRF